MKKLFLVLILPMLFLCGYSQIYTPQYPTQYGQKVNRIKSLLAQHIPEKSLELLTMDSTAQIFINTADSSLWCWYKHKGFFKIQSGNATIPTLQQVFTSGNTLGYKSGSWDINITDSTTGFRIVNNSKPNTGSLFTHNTAGINMSYGAGTIPLGTYNYSLIGVANGGLNMYSMGISGSQAYGISIKKDSIRLGNLSTLNVPAITFDITGLKFSKLTTAKKRRQFYIDDNGYIFVGDTVSGGGSQTIPGNYNNVLVNRNGQSNVLGSDSLTISGDTLKSKGYADFKNGFSSLASDGTGLFILDRQSGFPSLYLQSNDTTTDAGSNDTFFEMVASVSSGFSVSKYDAAIGVIAGISMNNGEVYLSGTGTIYLNVGSGGGFAISSPSNYETVLASQSTGTELLKYHRMTGKLNLSEYLFTNTSSGGLTLSTGTFEIPEGNIAMGITNNVIVFDYDGDLWNTISYDYDDDYGYGTAGSMLYRSNSIGHIFWIAEENREAARINSLGVRVPNVNSTSGSTLGTAYNSPYSSGLYTSNNDAPIAEFYEGGNIVGNTNKYRYAGEKFWINEGAAIDSAMLQANLYIAPLDGSNGVLNLWDQADGSFGYVKVSDGQVVFGSYTGETVLEPVTGTNIAQYRRNIASLNFPSTDAQSSSDLTMTVTGADVGNHVILNITSGTTSYYTAWVSAANTVTVRLNNYGSAAVDPASQTFSATVFK